MAATAKWDHGARCTAGYLDTSTRTPAALRRYLVCRYHCISPCPCRYAGHLCDPGHISISEFPCGVLLHFLDMAWLRLRFSVPSTLRTNPSLLLVAALCRPN